MPIGKFKYICEDCGEYTYFSRQERLRAAGMRCCFCGSRNVVPSKKSMAKDVIPQSHDARLEQKLRLDKECNW